MWFQKKWTVEEKIGIVLSSGRAATRENGDDGLTSGVVRVKTYYWRLASTQYEDEEGCVAHTPWVEGHVPPQYPDYIPYNRDEVEELLVKYPV